LNGPFDVVNFHNISLVGGPGILKLSRATVTLYTVHEHWLLCPTHILWKDLERACDGPQCLRCCMRSGLPPQLWRYTGLVERALTHVDALLAPSAFTAERHRTVAKHVPIHKMPTFSDIDPDVQVTAAKGARPRFVFVGRITASKGIAVLLDECEHTTAFDLDVVGDGDLRADLQRRYAHCAHIRFRGPVPQHDLVGLYQGATALVLPSLAPEVFPLTVLEAMACGTPAIVHDVGGNREAVDETGGGLVYDTRAELRNALFSMATDRELQLAMAQKARTGFERLYTRRQYLVRYLDLVRNISCRNSQATKA
jgi:glycosyltransferase involved in cell wall biosynthesis